MESSEIESLKKAALRASHNTHSFEGKPEERKKLHKYGDWICQEYPNLSIRSMAIAIREHGVDLSVTSLRRYIKTILVDRGVISDTPKSTKAEMLSPNSIKHEVTQDKSHFKPLSEHDDHNQFERLSSGIEPITSVNKSDNDKMDLRPQWVIDQEQKKLKKKEDEEEEIRQKPWKDQSLPMEERQRLQEEYITQNVDTVFKLKK